MGDAVERALEETIPLLRTATRLKLLTKAESKEIVCKRRDHEYAVCSRTATRTSFLRYAAFERALSTSLQTRAKARRLQKRKSQLVLGKSAARVNLVYSRAIRVFPRDTDLYLHYTAHCIRTGATRAAGRVFAKMIALCGHEERVWLAAIAFQFDTCGDAPGARVIAQRALRMLPESPTLWTEYFRMEISYLARLVSRRLVMGLSVDARAKRKADDDHIDNAGKRKRGKLVGGRREGGEDDDAADMGKENGPAGANGPDDQPVHEALDLPEAQPSLPDGHGGGDSPDQVGKDAADVAGDGVDAHDHMGDHDDDSEDNSDGSDSDGRSEDDAALSGDEQANNSDADGSTEDEHPEVAEQLYGKRLSFWDGGVPLSVFNNACQKTYLTPIHRAQFWGIAASVPYVPAMLLKALSESMSEKFPRCVTSLIVNARLPWDIMHAEYMKDMALQSEKVGEDDENQNPASVQKPQRIALATEARRVFSRTRKVLQQAGPKELKGGVKEAVQSLIEGFQTSCATLDESDEFKSESEAIISLVKSGTETEEGHKSVEELLNANSIPSLSVLQILKVLASEPKLSPDQSRQIYEQVKEKILVPFRDLNQEQALCAWISREIDLERLRDLGSKLSALPPITMESIRGMIAAEMRIWRDSEEQSTESIRGEMRSQTRKYFKIAISLSAAKFDVDLWLDYVDFERRISCDSKQAKMVSWKAMKTLERRGGEIFTEKQTLRNLVV